LGQGLYTYTAPANISGDTEVTVSAVNPANREPNAGGHTKATYTAPPASAKGGQVFVVAYLVNDQAAGLGIAVIKLSS
jgi:hypothetical protein